MKQMRVGKTHQKFSNRWSVWTSAFGSMKLMNKSTGNEKNCKSIFPHACSQTLINFSDKGAKWGRPTLYRVNLETLSKVYKRGFMQCNLLQVRLLWVDEVQQRRAHREWTFFHQAVSLQVKRQLSVRQTSAIVQPNSRTTAIQEIR